MYQVCGAYLLHVGIFILQEIPVIKNVVLRSNQLQVVLSDSEDSMNATDTAYEGPDSEVSRFDGESNNSDDLGIPEESPVKKVKQMDVATQTEKMTSPEKERLQRDVKVLKQRLRRYETKIINLKTILDVVLKKKKMKIIKS